MSINRNFTRTLSGANSFTIDNLELSSHKDTIRINGFAGNIGDVIGKDVNNRLVFQTLAPFVIDPDSIDGTKLTNNISITTTGNYNGNSMTLTGDLQVNNDTTIDNDLTVNGAFNFNGDLNIDDLTVDSLTLDENFVGNGNINLNQHKIVGDYVNLDINGNTGSIICFQLTTKDSVLIEDTLSVVGNIDTSGNLTLTTGNLEIDVGGIVAPAGTVECLDLETSGDITCDGDMDVIGDYTSTTGNVSAVSIVADDSVIADIGYFDDIKLPNVAVGFKIIIDGENGNIDTIGNFTTTAGNVETTSGNIFTTNGNIYANNGYIRGDVLRFLTKIQLGDTLSPTLFMDNTGLTLGSGFIKSSHTGVYASNDFALELTEANSHAFVGGNLKVDGTIFGNIVGEVSETHINGQSLTIQDLGDAGGNTGIKIENSYDFDMYSDSGTTKVFSIDGATGNIDSKDGGITLINGNINLTNGTLFGNIDGTITEELIDAQRLIIRDGGVAGANTEIDITDGSFNMNDVAGVNRLNIANTGAITMNDAGGSAVLNIFATGGITTASNILCDGSIFNMTGDGDIRTGTGNIRDGDTLGSSNGVINLSDPIIKLSNGATERLTLADNFIKLNDSSGSIGIYLDGDNSRIECGTFVDTSVIIEKDLGVSVGLANSMKTKLSCAGNLEYLNGDGEIIGFNDSSTSSQDDNTTLMKNMRIDETNFKYASREIAISKPTDRIEKKFTTTSTSWTAINDELYVNLKTNNRSATDFTVEWSYYAIKDDGMRLWAKLFDIDASSPEDADQPAYLNDTKQVLFDGGADKTGQHHGTFTMRNVSANIDKQIGVCVWTIVNSKSFINFYLGPASFSGDPPTGGSASSYGYGGMTLQIKKLYDLSGSANTPTGWSAPSSGM